MTPIPAPYVGAVVLIEGTAASRGVAVIEAFEAVTGTIRAKMLTGPSTGFAFVAWPEGASSTMSTRWRWPEIPEPVATPAKAAKKDVASYLCHTLLAMQNALDDGAEAVTIPADFVRELLAEAEKVKRAAWKLCQECGTPILPYADAPGDHWYHAETGQVRCGPPGQYARSSPHAETLRALTCPWGHTTLWNESVRPYPTTCGVPVHKDSVIRCHSAVVPGRLLAPVEE